MKTLNLSEAAAFIGIHTETLLKRAAKGLILGAYKEGRAWRFIDTKLEEYVLAKSERQNEERRIAAAPVVEVEKNRGGRPRRVLPEMLREV